MSSRGRWFPQRRGDFSPRRHNPHNFSQRPQRGRWGNSRGDRQPNNFAQRPRFTFGQNVPGSGRGGFQEDFRRDVPGKRLTECEIGTTEFISTLKGFSGIIKSRYSDFQVNEINMQGEIAKLTDLKVPKLKKDDQNKDGDEDLLILNKYNVEILPVDVWDKISALSLSDEKCTDKIEIDATDKTKDERTAIHNAVKKVFGAKIIGSTVSGSGEKKSIVFTKYYKGVRVDNREKWIWPGEYVHFLVHKENCDTMEAASRISGNLNMTRAKPNIFGYCGTKDRRGKTTQWFSIKKVDPNRIQKCCKNIRNILVGNYTFKDYHLNLGNLLGNRFRIALRNVTGDDETINTAVQNVKDNGFINYYGLQRFGSRADAPTYMIGRFLLQGKYREAIDIILVPHGPFSYQLETYQKTKDPNIALNLIPRKAYTSIEAKLLMGLASSAKNDLISALEKIPRNTRLLYIHSYQSWVWNRCVSERIKRFGLTCHVGDLVPLNPAELQEAKDIDDTCEWFNEGDEEMESGDADKAADSAKNADENGKSESSDPKKSSTAPVKVKALTEQDIKNNSHTIYDIVLPLPGYSIEYPPNMKDYYVELLKEDNLTLDLKQSVKQYSLSGTYRRMMAKAENLNWETIRYNDPVCDLILSDADELNGKKPPTSIPDGKYKALILDFNLASSTYATMALREILKKDTSSESQAQDNDYHKLPNAVEADKTADDSASIPNDIPASSTDESKSTSADPSIKPEEDKLPSVDKRKAVDDEDDSVEAKKAKTE